MRRALMRLARIMRPGHGKHRGQSSRRAQRDAIRDSQIVKPEDEQWILDLLEEHQ